MPFDVQYEAGKRSDAEILHEIDGVERVHLLPLATFVAIAPGTTPTEPPYAFIEWAPGVIERPYPGSAIWRATLRWYLEQPHPDETATRVLRPLVLTCLERFPTLDAYVHWSNVARTIPDRAEGKRRHSWRVLWPGMLWPW